MISVVIPAHNEEALLGATIEAIQAAFASVRGAGPFEIVVVDDDSTDRTAAVAEAAGARVVPAKVRQIAAARNAGARAARGEWLIFVDADTLLPASTLQDTLAALRDGVSAGGAPGRLPPAEPLWARASWVPLQWGMILLNMPGGAYMFMTRAAFDAAGGFDERYFASEEIHLARALKKIGRFRMVRHPVVTSGRKFRLLGFRGMMRELTRLAVRGPRALRSRKHLGLWYDKHRD